MADRIHYFDATIPASTPKNAASVTQLSFMEGRVTRVSLTFPDGCAGLVGINLSYGPEQVIPFDNGSWLRANNQRIIYDLHGYPTSNRWKLVGYNLDIYQHIIQVEFEIDDFTTAELAAVTFIPAEVLQ